MITQKIENLLAGFFTKNNRYPSKIEMTADTFRELYNELQPELDFAYTSHKPEFKGIPIEVRKHLIALS